MFNFAKIFTWALALFQAFEKLEFSATSVRDFLGKVSDVLAEVVKAIPGTVDDALANALRAVVDSDAVFAAFWAVVEAAVGDDDEGNLVMGAAPMLAADPAVARAGIDSSMLALIVQITVWLLKRVLFRRRLLEQVG